MRHLLAGAICTLFGLACALPALAQDFILNQNLIEATAPESAVYGPGAEMQSFPGYREETDYQPQDLGDVLYADADIIIGARTNFRITGDRKVGYPKRPETTGIVQRPLCYRDVMGARLRTGRDTWVPVHAMHVVAIIGKSPDFKITREWLWNEFQPKLRQAVTDRFCGGRTQVVAVDFHMFGLQHDFNGQVHKVTDTPYPSAGEVIRALNESGNPQGPIKKVSALGPFLSATYYFWDKIEPEHGNAFPAPGTVPDTVGNVAFKTSQGLIIPASGAHPSKGSYFEAFTPRWAPGAGLQTRRHTANDIFYDQAESASYVDYLTGRQAEVAQNRAIMEAREKDKTSLTDVLLFLGMFQRGLQCQEVYSDWGSVADRRDAWQERNCN